MNYEYASIQETTQNLNQTLRQQIETYPLDMKKPTDLEVEGSS
ncbi:MAG: hypothetical protein CLLPBCKN_001343 [Chroococcidiopsis cubana SAG 39.79]|nr:hypothetical protein [Chroococcidiopsis cubana SAG 39.79]